MRSSSSVTLPLRTFLVGEVLCVRGLRFDQLALARIRAVAPDVVLLAVQQIGQRMLVVHVGGRDDGAVRQARLAVYADVQLHAEVPLLPLAGLVHLRVALLVGILRRTGRTDDRGVHDRAGANLQSVGLQNLADLGEQRLTQLVLLQQAAELQQRGRVGYPLTPQVDANETPQRRTVQ